MGTGLGIHSTVFCLVLALSLPNLVSCSGVPWNYYVDALVDTRNAFLTYSNETDGKQYH